MDFLRGKDYSRPDIKELVGIGRDAKGGNWDTGITEYADEFFIFANVGTEGRTGHNYGNAWEGSELRWYHKGGSHLGWESVASLLASERIHVFWRASNADRFIYAGLATPIQVADTTPVEIIWGFSSNQEEPLFVSDPTELPATTYPLPASKKVLVNIYERSKPARDDCLAAHGERCSVCDFYFPEMYGELGAGFVHVHHLVPLHMAGGGYEINAVADLRPVCPNCHAMLHRRRPPFSIDELKGVIKSVALSNKPLMIT